MKKPSYLDWLRAQRQTDAILAEIAAITRKPVKAPGIENDFDALIVEKPSQSIPELQREAVIPVAISSPQPENRTSTKTRSRQGFPLPPWFRPSSMAGETVA